MRATRARGGPRPNPSAARGRGAARGGVATNWAIARPPGQTGPLRPIIALHGKGQDAAGVMAGGVEQGLAEAVAMGLPPVAVVAVDPTLSGAESEHALSSGRLCVMTSRHMTHLTWVYDEGWEDVLEQAADSGDAGRAAAVRASRPRRSVSGERRLTTWIPSSVTCVTACAPESACW